MPKIGEIKRGRDIGRKNKNAAYIWQPCEVCGEPRWVHVVQGQPYNKRCIRCAQKGHIETEATKLKKSLANRRSIDHKFISKNSGYVWVHLYRESPFYPMANKRNLIMEHRLVMARHVGRCLTSREHIHHNNGDKTDNRIENLELISQANHNMMTTFCHDCHVKIENKQLRLQIKQLLKQIKEMNLI